MRAEIFRRVGMPVGVGISTTKVLAKTANRLSKNNEGVCVLMDQEKIDGALKEFPVRSVWGIGSRSAHKLNTLNIKTAYDLKVFPDDQVIQKLLTKVGREIQDELRGVQCLTVESDLEGRKNVGNSRSFGYDVYDKKDLQEALAQFAVNSVLKLRAQKSVCHSITAFIHTNPFKSGEQYYGVDTYNFSGGTSDVMKVIQGAHAILERIYKPGHGYKKGGVLLNHIVPTDQNQMDLFCADPTDNGKLNDVLDLINKKYGPHTIKSAACGIAQPWKTIHDYKTWHYTTDFNQLLKIEL